MYVLRTLNANPPFFIMISLLDVKGYSMIVEPVEGNPVPRRDGIDRNDLILPEIQMESTDVDRSTFLKSSFDMIWNAAGWSASQNYDRGCLERLVKEKVKIHFIFRLNNRYRYGFNWDYS